MTEREDAAARPRGVRLGSDPLRKTRRASAPSAPEPPPEHDPIHATYDALDALLRHLIEAERVEERAYALVAIREALHGGSI